MPITAGDITLWCHHTSLHPNLPLNLLLQTCTQVSICIRNQKNGKRDAIISHFATKKFDCPVAAIVRRMHHIHNNTTNPSTTIISTYFNSPNASGYTISATTINSTIRAAATHLKLHQSGFPLNRLSSHSLRAGGAMALHQAGIQSYVIQKLGRWSSDTFMTYIQNQLSSFSLDLALKMSTQQPFHNLVGASPTLTIQP
jgi:integrase